MLKIFYRFIWQTSWRYLWLFLVPLVIGLLQWLLNINELGFFLFGGQISFLEGVDIIGEGVFSVFTLPTDFTPIAFIIIALLQATSLALVFILRRARRNNRKMLRQASSMGVAVVGAGCVACGGSLVTPLLGLVATNISLQLASTIGDILLMIAIVLSFLVLRSITSNTYFTMEAR